MEKIFENFLKFNNRPVKFYRSTDPYNTSVYFTENKNKRDMDSKAWIDLLWFDYDGGDHQIYIKFPETDYFVEIMGGGMGSGRGNMTISSGKNVWEERDYKQKISILRHADNLLLSMGESIPEFNFMKKIAEYDKGNKFSQSYPNEKFDNYDEIQKIIFNSRYLKIPEDIRSISYCFKTKDKSKYFLVDCPAYNFKYDNHRFFVIENKIPKQYTIKGFDRYRDGGTTFITVTDENGKDHVFFSPTFAAKDLCEKWDDTELIKVTKNEEAKLVKLLNID
jgi:hypothetical protein